MFRKSILVLSIVALSAPFAGAAFAGPGADQMARQLGVAPGAYTLSQMMQIEQARQDGDRQTEAFILSQGAGFATRAETPLADAVTPGARQLAGSLGVAPGTLSMNDLIRLQDALLDNDRQTAAFILNGSADGSVGNDLGVVTPGKAQLAATVAVDPAAYTTSDIVEMFAETN